MLAVAAGGVVTLAACRSKSESPAKQGSAAGSAAASASPIAACSLLADDEIKKVTGRAVKAKKPGSSQGIFAEGCQWTLDGGEGSGIPDIDLGVRSTGGLKYYEDHFERYIGDPDQALKTQRLSGVGDKGLIDEMGDVMAVKHDVLISINYTAVPRNKTVATELTKLVVDHHL
ncbi:MAG: hypothetical protein ACM31C_16160 [Acidobacteriota bacterium]